MKIHILLHTILFFTLIEQIISACSAPTPYSYLTNCYAQCPWNPPVVTYLDTANSQCLTTCTGTTYASDATKSCVSTCPTSPILTYYDKNRKKCVQNCSSNPSQYAYLTNYTCVQYCPSDLFASDQSRQCVSQCPQGTYYQIINSLRICTARCYPNYYANLSGHCVAAADCYKSTDTVKYYGDDSTNLCVENCPQNKDTYASDSAKKCVYICPLGTFGDPTTLKCVTNCPLSPLYFGSNTTRLCHMLCPQGQFGDSVTGQCTQFCSAQSFGDYSTRLCVSTCPISEDTYADNTTRLCIQTCSPNSYADNDTRTCVQSTDCSDLQVGDPLTLKCINAEDCPSSYFIDWVSKLCVQRCPTNYFANLDSKQCVSVCQWSPPTYVTWYETQTRTCAQKCPQNPRTFGDNSTRQCVQKCPDGTYGDTMTNICLETCPDGFHSDQGSNLCVSDCTTNASVILYFYIANTTCVTNCPQGTYADIMTLTCVRQCPTSTYAYQSNNTCVYKCPDTTYADHLTQTCVSTCPDLTAYYADNSTNMCVKVCPVDPDYYGQDINNGHRKCVSSCTHNDTFADPITRTCVKQCNTTAGYFGYYTSGRCQLSCPTGWGHYLTKVCQPTCPQSPFQYFGDNITKTCVKKCPNNTYGDKTKQICMVAKDCAANTYGDDSTNLCVSICPAIQNTFGDPVTKKCVYNCQFNYYADNKTRLCAGSCSSLLYKDPSTKTCVLNCPSFPDLYNQKSTMSCVAHCSTGYAYANNTIRKCVSMCPSSPSYFADEQNKKCVLKCANLTYKFVNNSYRGCLSYCPPQIYSATYSVDLYEDNTTWTCVSVCPTGYYAFKHPTNATFRKCVKRCQMVGSTYYFADNVSRSCVTACPMKLYATYGDRINFKCVKVCSREQFRDNTTKQCQYRCSSGYYADNTTYSCLKKCPNGTFAEDTNLTCVKFCPTGFYGHENKCISICPSNTVYFSDNTTWLCMETCPAFPDYYMDPNQQICVDQCTGGLFADNDTRTCVPAINCTDTRADPVHYRCVQSCTKQPMYFWTNSTNLCGPTCSDGLFADNSTNQCVEICPSPYYGVNSTVNYICVQYCPLTQYKYQNQRMCVSVCPEGFYADDLTMSCVQICPDDYYANQGDNTCIQSCTPLYASDLTKSCVSICPNGTTASNNSYHCQQQCDYGQFQQNKVCQTGCSNGFFADNLTRVCVQTCPDDPMTYADSSNNKCVFNCSAGSYAYDLNRTCQTVCPDGLYKQLTLLKCMYPCLQNQFADPVTNSCISSCTNSPNIFGDPYSRICVQTCSQDPDLYGYNNMCIQHCPDTLFAQNFSRTCVSICPNVSATVLNQSFADDLTRRCVRRCSALSYAHVNISHNVCLNNCPDGFFASQIQQACVQVCPNNTYAHNTSKRCVQECPLGQYADFSNNICMDGCYNASQYKDNSTKSCVAVCPKYPDLYAQVSSDSCVLSCQTGFYAYNQTRQCLNACPQPYFADPSTLLCVLDCPVNMITFADNDTRKCISDCVNVTINGNQVIFYSDITSRKCVQSCPQDPKYYGHNQSNTCVQKCPANTYGDNDTRLCLDRCVFENPKFTWMDDLDWFCVQYCPYGYYADNYTFKCQKNCSVSTFADNSTRRCVFQCPVDPGSFGVVSSRTCVYFCPGGLFADEVTRVCISVCPKTPSYYFHYTPTNKCVKQCLYPYFGQIESQYCVQICKDGFYGNLTTHKCQSCKTECVTCTAYLQCTSCTQGFYLYNSQCVLSCPSYPVVYYAHQQSLTCFKNCPEPYFGLKSTGLCQLTCPTKYYGSVINRTCTKCPTGCISCDPVGCYDCQTNYTWVQTTLTCNAYCNSTHIFRFESKCYLICPQGSFLTNDLINCQKCLQVCAACVATAQNCTKCAYQFYYNGQCVDKCPSDYFVDENLHCKACQTNPSKCTLPALKYEVKPFTENFQLHAFVIFNRPVKLNISKFVETVQIKLNGKAVKSSQFTSVVYNQTTFKISFRQSRSLNENSLSIGFQPGTITDQFGNQLTSNTEQTSFQDKSGVDTQVISASENVSIVSTIIGWLVLLVVLLFLIKGGYPVLITIQVIQLVYMHTFILANPMPYLQFKFFQSIRYFHFAFIPSLFPTLEGYSIQKYAYFLPNTSFLANCSPLLVIFGFVMILYLIFYILSRKSLISKKAVYKFARKVRKFRLRYSIINDAFWFTYLYAVFMAALQLKQIQFKSFWDVINILAAFSVLALFIVYTLFVVYLGVKYKDKDIKEQVKIPNRFSFISNQPSSFPMQLPLRYIRKLLFCFFLVLPFLESQVVLLIMLNLVFLAYLICFQPSKSKLTNAINITSEVVYIAIEGLFFAYQKLDKKGIDQQSGFAAVLVALQSLIMIVLLIWIVYRFILVIRQTDTWKYIYAKVTENKDPNYLKQQQRKRDLEYDFGSLENRSQDERTQDYKPKKFKYSKAPDQKDNIFNRKQNLYNEDSFDEDFLPGQKSKKLQSELISEQSNKYQPRKTSPNFNRGKTRGHLEIKLDDDDEDLEEINVASKKSSKPLVLEKIAAINKSQIIEGQKKDDNRAIWDDIEFDDNQI